MRVWLLIEYKRIWRIGLRKDALSMLGNAASALRVVPNPLKTCNAAHYNPRLLIGE